MYMAAGAVICIYVILFILSRKEDLAKEYKGIGRPFYCTALFLYKHACIRKMPFFANRQVEKDLERLYPGKNGKQLCTEYYVKKIALFLFICLAGTMLSTVLCVKSEGERILDASGNVVRGSWMEEEKEITVTASMEEACGPFIVKVGPKKLEEEEVDALYQNFREELLKSIAGDNTSLMEVTKNLHLTEKLEGYPFSIEWESSRPDLVNSSGKVETPMLDEEVLLTARIAYEDMEWQEKISVCVICPVLSQDELKHRELKELLLASESASREEEIWKLPDNYNGQKISWNQVKEDNSLLLWVVVLAVSVLVYFLADKDLHDNLDIRKKQMKMEYPDIVQKLVLYLGAGLTVRGAFRKIAGDYERAKSAGRKEKPIYEEMLYTCRELQAGISEGAAYEHFGKRTGIQEYIRLSTLLQQNLKKGNSTLLSRLKEEADKSSLERIQNSRRLGEEASTKLLVPMVMMLAVVMIMVMVPAFSSTTM